MKKARQLGFEILEKNNVKHFGGGYLLKSNPKRARPISVKNSMHFVMRSLWAVGSRSFLKYEFQIQKIINTQAKNFGVKIYRHANGGNHIHLILLPRSRKAFHGFVRSITGLIARLILKAERGRSKGIQFWEQRPFTRIVEWGRDYKKVCDYLLRNTLEALGFIAYQPRKKRFNPKTSTA